MTQQAARIRQEMKTPRAAAIAGILFSLLSTTSFLLFRISISPNPLSQPTGMIRHSKTISLALYLLPFAGIAFLWFMGVIRDRLGEYEDRFFATVFLGSGLLFVAMIFTVAAEMGGIITVLGHERVDLIQSGSYYLGRAEAYQTMNIYAAKMAGVFMTATCTISLQTRILPRWMAWLGYALALILLLSIGRVESLFLLFPLWVLLISVYILMEDLRSHSHGATQR
jgi:hypothetical protein